MNSVKVNMELEASRQIVLHFFEDHRKEPRSNFIYYFNERFSGFVARIKIFRSKTLDYNQIDQLM